MAARPSEADGQPSGNGRLSARRSPGVRAVLGALRRHWLFAALVASGLALRVVVTLAYRPALFTITDSEWYLAVADNLEPSTLRPVGYSAFLRALPLGFGLELVPIVQHLLGLLAALLLYAVLLRLGVRPWLAALATAPALLDSYLLNVEQQILAEALFALLVVAACCTLLWRRPLGVTPAVVAGLLLAAAALVRPIGVAIVLPVFVTVLFLPARRRRVVTALSLLAAFAVPLGVYAIWFHAEHDRFALSSKSGRYLYGRVVQFVDCAEFEPPAHERPLCPAEPVGERPGTQELMWSQDSPVLDVRPPPGETRDDVAGAFARRVILNQPLDYVGAVALDVVRGFAPTKTTGETDFPVSPWQFQPDAVTFFRGTPCRPEAAVSSEIEAGCAWRARRTRNALAAREEEGVRADRDLAAFLRVYQSFAYLPGPILAAALLLALAAVIGVGRARHSGLRAPVFLFAGLALALLLGSAAVSTFSWRYQLPLLLLVPAATALAVTAFASRAEGRSEAGEEPAPVGAEPRMRFGTIARRVGSRRFFS
jgi:4-amino-4-deoxy-L-arabinose transferase-like glycosyltransferase